MDGGSHNYHGDFEESVHTEQFLPAMTEIARKFEVSIITGEAYSLPRDFKEVDAHPHLFAVYIFCGI